MIALRTTKSLAQSTRIRPALALKWGLWCGLLLLGAGCRTVPTDSTSQMAPGARQAMAAKTPGPILRQCQWSAGSAAARRVVFHKTPLHEIRHTVDSDAYGLSVKTHLLSDRPPAGTSGMLPKDLEAPDHAACVGVSTFTAPTQLARGQRLYLPLGVFKPLSNLEGSATFTQSYVAFRIFQVETHSLSTQQVLAALCRNNNAMAARQQENTVTVSGVFEDVGIRWADGRKQTLDGNRVVDLVQASPVYLGGNIGDDALGLTPESFVGWPMGLEPNGQTYQDPHKTLRTVYRFDLLKQPFGTGCSGKDPDAAAY